MNLELKLWAAQELTYVCDRLQPVMGLAATGNLPERTEVVDALGKLAEAVDSLVAAVERPTLRIVR